MLQPNTVAGPATFSMVAVCVLGIGFLVRFFVALASEENKMRVAHPVGSKGVHYATDGPCEPPHHKWAGVDSGAHVALGVLRITTALTSNPSRANGRAAAERSNIVTFVGPARESDSTTERRYRLS